jgi:hypothetical protein
MVVFLVHGKETETLSSGFKWFYAYIQFEMCPLGVLNAIADMLTQIKVWVWREPLTSDNISSAIDDFKIN